MYTSDYNRSNSNMMVVLGIVMLIVGFTLGTVVNGGTGNTGPIDVDDTDEVLFGNQRILDDDSVDVEYFMLTGQHLNEIGNPHDSVAIKTFELNTLEVNQFTYFIRITDDGTEVFVAQETTEGPEILVHITDEYGDLTGDIMLVSRSTITIYVFFEGIHIVSIEGVAGYV
jgi:hypothetical protein